MIDIHCHLEYMENPEQVVDEAKQKMTAIISSVADIKDKEKILELAKKNKGFVFVSLGFHPERINKYSDFEINEYIQFIRDNKEKIVAIGECGLDYLQVKDRERSKAVFIKFIELAKELSLPLVLHVRDEPGSNAVFDDIFNILEKHELTAVLHCFSGSEGQLKTAIERGYYISYATIVCKSDKHKRLAEKTPLESMLLETDSPWLHPTSREMINRPWMIVESAKVISELKNTIPEKIMQKTEENAKKVFKLEV